MSAVWAPFVKGLTFRNEYKCDNNQNNSVLGCSCSTNDGYKMER